MVSQLDLELAGTAGQARLLSPEDSLSLLFNCWSYRWALISTQHLCINVCSEHPDTGPHDFMANTLITGLAP